jgi:hypothetical protein
MPSAPILCLGALWKAEDFYWKSAPANGKLIGVPSANVTGAEVNFADQSGIYVLYSDFTPIYVGQAKKRLFARLKEHFVLDDLQGRWNRFTWFGLRKALANGDLSVHGVDFHISTDQLLDHLEAVMIHGFEPPRNGQDGRFGKNVTRYAQVRDSRLGPSDRKLMEMIATNGAFLPTNISITPTGWR